MANFHLLDIGVKGSLMNVYGPSGFPHKHAFLDLLSWVKGLTEVRNWVIGGDFNLISNLGDNKGVDGPRTSIKRLCATFWPTIL